MNGSEIVLLVKMATDLLILLKAQGYNLDDLKAEIEAAEARAAVLTKKIEAS